MMDVTTTTRACSLDLEKKPIPILKTMRRLRDAGFRVLDWYAPDCELLGDATRANQLDAWKRWAGEAREQAERLGLSFRQMHALDQDLTKGQDQVDHVEAMNEMSFHAAQILGVRCAAIHPLISKPGRRDRASCLKDNTAYFRRKSEVAGRFGITLALENMLTKRHFDGRMEWRFCTCLEDHVELVQSIDCENVRYCFDVGHANYTNTDVRSAIAAMKDDLVAIHVHDNDGFSDQHLIPFQGTIDFEIFTRALANDYRGDMTMEVLKGANGMPTVVADPALKTVYESARYLAGRVWHHKHKREE